MSSNVENKNGGNSSKFYYYELHRQWVNQCEFLGPLRELTRELVLEHSGIFPREQLCFERQRAFKIFTTRKAETYLEYLIDGIDVD